MITLDLTHYQAVVALDELRDCRVPYVTEIESGTNSRLKKLAAQHLEQLDDVIGKLEFSIEATRERLARKGAQAEEYLDRRRL